MITTRFTFHQPPHNFALGTLKTFLFLGDSFTRTQEKRETQKNGEWVLLANTQINANPTQCLWHFSEKKVLKLYIVITNNNYRIISYIPVFRRSWVAITAPVCGGGELKVSHKYGFLLYVSHLNELNLFIETKHVSNAVLLNCGKCWCIHLLYITSYFCRIHVFLSIKSKIREQEAQFQQHLICS